MVSNDNDDNKRKKLSAAQYNCMPPADKCQTPPFLNTDYPLPGIFP